VQLGGAALAAWFLQAVVHVSSSFGSNYPASGFSHGDAFWMELILTFGLVSVILGTASGAQNLGVIGALGVGSYIALAGLWGSPISGAHLNPAVSVGFALRGDFPWWRVPGYIVVQLGGAALAAWFLQAVVHVSASFGSNYPASGFSDGDAFWMELILTFGLLSVILGTASGAQNIGVIGALGVGSYIALAGLWGSPISGASMNPARTFGPDVVAANFHAYWVYVAGPLAGAVVAVGVAFVLRGRGGGRAGSGAAQGGLFTEIAEPDKA